MQFDTTVMNTQVKSCCVVTSMGEAAKPKSQCDFLNSEIMNLKDIKKS